MRVLITGANRGIGLEFVRQYLDRGDRVFATARQPAEADALNRLAEQHPDRLTVLPLEVTDGAQVAALPDAVCAEEGALDLLINNAGVNPKGERPGALDAETMQRTLAVNSVAPIQIAQALLDALAEGENPRIVNVTSQLGSLERKRSGGGYSYAASKAALNMFSKALAFDLRPRGITVVMVHPGWVQTDMGGSGAPLTPQEAVRSMIELFDGLEPADAARYLQWDGSELPW